MVCNQIYVSLEVPYTSFYFIQVIQYVNFAPYIFVQLCSNMPCWSVNLFDFAQEKLLECFSLSAIFPVQN